MTALSFDDVLIVPKFSSILSRRDVNTDTPWLGSTLRLPIISSNMDSVTEAAMAKAMADNGAYAALHRFWDIEKNVAAFLESVRHTAQQPMVSVGLGDAELDRAEALFEAGADAFLIDVAHGASIGVVGQVKALRGIIGNNASLVVGNFATRRSLEDFFYHLGNKNIQAVKIGVGGGSACLTRVVTGCGLPTLASIQDCAPVGVPMIADGGIRNSGDIAKALAAGATTVMLGRLLAGAEESPATIVANATGAAIRYRGSASMESYEVQGKVAEWRAPEGDAFFVPYTGPVRNTLNELGAGLRSAMSYVGATNLAEFREAAELVQITSGGAAESKAHGKTA